eukprot:Hpha_TRINITY_DN14581_c0_g1::TRINITY_DN14581_c0_g1_i1::g.47216::m.47216
MEGLLTESEHQRLFEQRLLERKQFQARVVEEGGIEEGRDWVGGAIVENDDQYEDEYDEDETNPPPPPRTELVPRVADPQLTAVRDHLLAQKRREQREREEVECTYRPRINRYSARSRSNLSTFDRLSRDTTNEHVDKLRKRKEEEELAGCTFQPRLHERTEAFVAARRPGAMEDPGARLYREAEELKRRKQEREKEAKSREAESVQRPRAVSDMGSPTFHLPLHERLEEVRREKAARMEALREKYGAEQSATFQPRIARGPALDVSPRTELDVVERLSRVPDNVSNVAGAREAAEMQEGPRISERSRRLVAQREEFAEGVDCKERLLGWGREQRQRLDHLREQAYHEGARRPKRLPSQRIDEAVENLRSKGREREQKLKAMQEEQTEGLFKPRVGTARRRCHSDTTHLRESLRGSRRKKEDDVARLEETAKLREDAECTFAPTIDRKSKRMAAAHPRFRPDPYGRDPKARARAEMDKAKRRMMEESEMTFNPVISHYNPTAKEPDAAVSGVESFLRRAEHARAMQEDKKRREEALNRVKRSAVAGAHREDRGGRLHTVPQPFELSTTTRVQRRGADGYSFHPATNEGARSREVLRRVLEEEEDDEADVATIPLPSHPTPTRNLPSTARVTISMSPPPASRRRGGSAR